MRFSLLVFLAISFNCGILLAAEPNWDDYSLLLKRHVSSGIIEGIQLHVVDYEAIKDDPHWPKIVRLLEEFPPEQLENRNEKIAFYINAYNILAIKMVIDHWPLKSIRDVGSLFIPVWKRPAGKIGGMVVSLDDIEHKILRPMHDPRVHMAIVCASISCPDLRREAYRAVHINEQLNDQSRAFLANPGKGVRVEDERIFVSKIFDWFEEDFDNTGGVSAFMAHHYPDLPLKLPTRATLPYNWNLNTKL
ncbi:MAG: DUF547 domain-containing protein [Mariprofundaceae bacterium]